MPAYYPCSPKKHAYVLLEPKPLATRAMNRSSLNPEAAEFVPWCSHPDQSFPIRVASSASVNSITSVSSSVTVVHNLLLALVDSPSASVADSIRTVSPSLTTAQHGSLGSYTTPSASVTESVTTVSSASTNTHPSCLVPGIAPSSSSAASGQNAVQPVFSIPGEAIESSIIDSGSTHPGQVAQSRPPKTWAEMASAGTTRATPHTYSQSSEPLGRPTEGEDNKTIQMAKAILSYSVDGNLSGARIPFLEPRGLINTGNMCYMNAVLQVLVFCTPFYQFLDGIGKRASYSFKSDTPLVDAMIMFIKEYRVIDSASSKEQLQLRLKDSELEQCGEPFKPQFVYEVLKQLPRFTSMESGHQQDAQEFMVLLLESLHDECTAVLKWARVKKPEIFMPSSQSSSKTNNGWLEVGAKRRPALRQTSGVSDSDSPLAKIFGGLHRSEFKVAGAKTSVTVEPYQALQLDITSSAVQTVNDALEQFAKPEPIIGFFQSGNGARTRATKQTFLESLPPVLILHLKRFNYDEFGGVTKIDKPIGYPAELSLQGELFAPIRRAAISKTNPPRYSLLGVISHHGTSAAGGHYTVDLRRQDGREWMRIDDGTIRRVVEDDVLARGTKMDGTRGAVEQGDAYLLVYQRV